VVSLASLWWVATAHAVDVPFTPPAEVGLFTQVASVSARASAEGDACDDAAEAALGQLQAKAERAGTPTLINASPSGECKQSRTGDTVLSSAVSLDGVAIAPAPEAPTVTAQRALAIAATLGAPQGGLEEAALVVTDAGAWVSLGPIDPGEVQGAPGARAANAFLAHVVPEAASWGAVLPTLPELAGLAVEVLDEGKGRKRGALRFHLPSEAIAAWRRGEVPDEVLLSRGEVMAAPPGKERTWAPLQVDLSTAGQTGAELRTMDVDDEDLEGLEDEEDP